jgi:hypothetical protein
MPTSAFPHDREALDAVFLHQGDDGAEIGVLRDRLDVVGHDFVDPAGVGVNVILGERAGAEQEFDPARARALGSGLRAAQKIPFGDMPARFPLMSTTGRPLILLSSIRRSASRIEASGVTVITCWSSHPWLSSMISSVVGNRTRARCASSRNRSRAQAPASHSRSDTSPQLAIGHVVKIGCGMVPSPHAERVRAGDSVTRMTWMFLH